MRRTLSNGARAGLVLLLTGASVAAAQPEPLPIVTVLVDNAKVIRLPEKTATVIVGNPIIAEVTPQKNGVLVLTGKSFGSTNLIALDTAGGLIAETMIRVEASRDSTITVQRGLDRESLSCTPNCQPAVQLGDSANYFGTTSGQADARRKLATGGGAAGPQAAEH
ncbi:MULTISPECIES: pilus assembly protein N-terminal domain-containing protein [unclassified Methylobacterium]|uniref:pilus assembly protein N-terminal domain-containing protein n=1 Tax=unclassified Methylobacterium TaxID=2615210 RepID=UPI001FB91B10|nr:MULTISPECIES: pilus assembly protein N-terminal domain-containing protein [unclassified Methylobacterium]MCJ2092486.1 pilus assembly protein N-terminal domain-containing protein [Methylobacterium sp. J-072]MCJ2142661.1 pilus assembly protein N-terminal domain-containing protein [Methylobacterium sp. E-066]